MEARSRREQVHRMEFDVDWPPGHVACYFVAGPEPILVDAALPAHERELRASLNDQGFDVGDVEHLLITHPHVDHIGQVPTVLREANPTVYAPVGVRDRFDRDVSELGTRVRRNCMEAGMADEHVDGAVDMAVESLERNASLLPTDAVDVWIEPGEPVDVGHLRCDPVHTPGHQADHLCYRTDIGGERALLAGDMAIEPFRPVVMHDGLDDGHRTAFDAFYAALDRLEKLDADRIYPGHGPVHTDLQSTIERDRDSLDHRLRCVVELLDGGLTTVPEIAVTLAGDRSVKYLVPEAMSALAHLERTGAVESHLEAGVRQYENA